MNLSRSAALLLILLSTASAVPIPITNPGFESNVLPNPSPGANDNFITAVGEGSVITTVPGWNFSATQVNSFTCYGGVSDLGIGNHAPDGLIDNNIAWLFINEGRQTGTISVEQLLSATLQNNTRYTLTARVAQAAHSEGNPALDNPVFPALGNGVSTGDVFARLYLGTPATPMPGFLSGLSFVSVPADDTWVNWTLVWETAAAESLAGATLGIQLFNRANTSSLTVPVEVFFDDIALNAVAVPESGSLALVGFASVCALAMRPKRILLGSTCRRSTCFSKSSP